MNNKGQTMIVAFMLATVVIILGIAWAWPVNEITTNAMNETYQIGGDGMNCTGVIDDFTKAGCLAMDINQSFFIGSIIAIAGIIIGAKLIWS